MACSARVGRAANRYPQHAVARFAVRPLCTLSVHQVEVRLGRGGSAAQAGNVDRRLQNLYVVAVKETPNTDGDRGVEIE